MSWSRSYTSLQEFETATDAPSEPRQREQHTVAKAAVEQILNSFAFDGAKDVNVSLGEHASPEPGPGDSISIYINRKA